MTPNRRGRPIRHTTDEDLRRKREQDRNRRRVFVERQRAKRPIPTRSRPERLQDGERIIEFTCGDETQPLENDTRAPVSDSHLHAGWKREFSGTAEKSGPQQEHSQADQPQVPPPSRHGSQRSQGSESSGLDICFPTEARSNRFRRSPSLPPLPRENNSGSPRGAWGTLYGRRAQRRRLVSTRPPGDHDVDSLCLTLSNDIRTRSSEPGYGIKKSAHSKEKKNISRDAGTGWLKSWRYRVPGQLGFVR